MAIWTVRPSARHRSQASRAARGQPRPGPPLSPRAGLPGQHEALGQIAGANCRPCREAHQAARGGGVSMPSPMTSGVSAEERIAVGSQRPRSRRGSPWQVQRAPSFRRGRGRCDALPPAARPRSAPTPPAPAVARLPGAAYQPRNRSVADAAKPWQSARGQVAIRQRARGRFRSAPESQRTLAFPLPAGSNVGRPSCGSARLAGSWRNRAANSSRSHPLAQYSCARRPVQRAP